jgi:hypothetical protein
MTAITTADNTSKAMMIRLRIQSVAHYLLMNLVGVDVRRLILVHKRIS